MTSWLVNITMFCLSKLSHEYYILLFLFLGFGRTLLAVYCADLMGGKGGLSYRKPAIITPTRMRMSCDHEKITLA